MITWWVCGNLRFACTHVLITKAVKAPGSLILFSRLMDSCKSLNFCDFLEADLKNKAIRVVNESKSHFTQSTRSLRPTFIVERIEKRFAMRLENPGARHDCAMKPSFSSERQMTSSPPLTFQLGMLRRCALLW